MKVVIIGSGNVATVLGRKILAGGHEITEVAGRNKNSVSTLASELKSGECYNLMSINSYSDIYIITVSDNAVADVAGELRVKEKLVVHVAASVPKATLRECSENYGIIYPVQSLRKELQEPPLISVLIDGSNESTNKRLYEFCKTWASSVEFADDDERLKLHVAAVIVNNFTNHLFTLTSKYCEAEGLKFEVLYPLISETIERLKSNRPSEVQTGPAMRNDINTIEKHLNILEQHPELKNLYQIFSSSIMKFYKNSR